MSADVEKSRQFLVGSVRAYLAGEPPPVTLGPEPVDWEAFTRLADFHCVAPLLARALQDGDAPDAAREALAASARANASRSLLLTGELARLLKHLDAQGIEAIPFKGPALAVQLYGDPALRHFDDLDVLVRRENFATARSIVLAQGYQPGEQHPFHESFTLAKGNIEIIVELHWDIMNADFPLRLDMNGIWERRVTFSLGGAQTAALAPEDLLLFLCAHGSRHLWLRLQWICDVAQLLRRYPLLNWEQVIARAEIARGRRMLRLGIFLAHDILAAPLPPEIAQTAHRDPAVMKLFDQVRWRLFEGPLQLFKPWKGINFKVQLIDRAWDRFRYTPRYWLQRLTTPSEDDRNSLPLPNALAPLYLLTRPVRLAVKYGRRVVSGFYRY